MHYCGTRQVPSTLLVAYPPSECSLQLRLAMQGDVDGYVVQVKMALWIIVLPLGTFGPSESVLIVDSAVLFSKKKKE